MATTGYSDRMLTPEPRRRYWVREGNRLIPIPTGRATPTATVQPRSSAEGSEAERPKGGDQGADAPSKGQ